MAGWVRSLTIADIITVTISRMGSTLSVRSVKGRAELHIFDGDPLPQKLRWFIQLADNFPLIVANEEAHLRANKAGVSTLSWTPPYWSIVIPLTLISSWLLLSKRRQTTSKKFAEPIQGEGGGATS